MPAIRAKYGARGPIVEATIGVSEPLKKLLRSKGQDISLDIPIQLLIDTGADTTTVAEMHMRSLKLESTGASPVRTITSGATGAACNAYGVSLNIKSAHFGDAPLRFPTMQVLADEFHNEGFDGLLGRDVLSTLVFVMDGPRRSFSIEWA